MTLTAEFHPASLTAEVAAPAITAKLSEPVVKEYVEVPYYDGPYEFTPSEDSQEVDAKWLRMQDNIIINPIPSNYGKITWDGTTLTVS